MKAETDQHSGQRIKVAYKISLLDGQRLEEAKQSAPEIIQLGEGSWPIQLELALMGEAPGSEISVDILAGEQAFGEFDPARVQQLVLSDFGDTPPESGQLIEFTLPNGEQLEGVVTELDQTHAEVDFNHPYIGRDLHIDVTIVEVLE